MQKIIAPEKKPSKKPKLCIPTEHDEQVMFVQWLRYSYPHIKFFSVPNGVRTGFKQAIKAKREGMCSGVPDICIPRRPPGRNFNIWVEMKRLKGGVVSDTQKEWGRYLEEHCEDVVIIGNGCEDAIKKIRSVIGN